jgi:hypothetical protein
VDDGGDAHVPTGRYLPMGVRYLLELVDIHNNSPVLIG